MDYKIEVVMIPVTDIDRAVDFYVSKLGFALDVDHDVNEDFRIVQVTPPGSACSIIFGRGMTDTKPGSYKGTHIVVNDIEKAYDELTGRGVACAAIRHLEDGVWVDGPDPQRADYQSFSEFIDPDGNAFTLQEVGHGTG